VWYLLQYSDYGLPGIFIISLTSKYGYLQNGGTVPECWKPINEKPAFYGQINDNPHYGSNYQAVKAGREVPLNSPSHCGPGYFFYVFDYGDEIKRKKMHIMA
jgi:hypothetical protein